MEKFMTIMILLLTFAMSNVAFSANVSIEKA